MTTMNYELGLQLLKSRLSQAALIEFYIFEARLRENLDRESLYGSTEAIRADRAEIVRSLNELVQSHLGESFNDLCTPSPCPTIPSANDETPPAQSPDLTNPFYTAGRIDDPARFFGRTALLHQLFDDLRKGGNRLLIGPAGMGKSSILSMVRKLGPARLGLPTAAFIYLDMRLVRGEDQFFVVLCKRLGIPTSRGYDLGDALTGKRYILCLDEIENMRKTSFSGDEREELRGFAEGDAPFKLVIASRLPLDQLFPDSSMVTSPLANVCPPLQVPPFTLSEARAFVEERMRGKAVVFSEAEIEVLTRQSGGNPGALQRAAAALFEQKRGDGI
jgi:hypothetical protein